MSAPSRRQWLGWTALALLLFAAALSRVYGETWRDGVSEYVPSSADPDDPKRGRWVTLHEADLLYSVAIVARNARTLARHPARLFDPDHCHPVSKSLTLGEPMIELALLGLPAWLASGDPVTTYNVAVALSTLLGTLAMYALVGRWTRSPPAALVAGLLFGFHHAKLRTAIHPYVYDSAWLVLALLFAREWLARGRWRDALAFALCVSLQLTGSLYPLLTGGLMAIPLLAWLLREHGVRQLRASQLLAVGALTGVTAVWVYAPQLAVDPARDFHQLRDFQVLYGAWRDLLPGRRDFPGWLAVALSLAALAWWRPRAGLGDPRWALLLAAALVAFVGAGGNAQAVSRGTAPFALPNPWEWLESLVPGVDRVRRAGALRMGVHWALCILAGLGVAALLARLPVARRRLAALALVALTAGYSLRSFPLAGDPAVVYAPHRAAPPQRVRDFFARIEARGDSGPLLEVGLSEHHFEARAAAVLMAVYHGRRTSACYGSYLPASYSEIQALTARLPAPEALAIARELGFTTIVLHRPRREQDAQRLSQAFEAAARGPDAPLRLLASDPVLAAFAIAPSPQAAGGQTPQPVRR